MCLFTLGYVSTIHMYCTSNIQALAEDAEITNDSYQLCLRHRSQHAAQVRATATSDAAATSRLMAGSCLQQL